MGRRTQTLKDQQQYWHNKATDLTLQMSTLELSIAQDDQATEEEVERLMQELASVEASLATLQSKN